MEINRQLSSTQMQNRSFLVIHWTRTTSKCAKMKNVRAKRAKVLNVQICDVLINGVVVVAYTPYWSFVVWTLVLRQGFDSL